MVRKEINNAITVPEDEGTGLARNSADWISAGHIAGLNAHQNNADYVENGCDFHLNGTELTIDGGLVFIHDRRSVHVQNNAGQYNRSWEHGVVYGVHVGPNTVELEAGELNHVFLEIDLTTNNGCYYVVETGSNPPAPSGPHLRLGTVDYFDGGVDITEDNREPYHNIEQARVSNAPEHEHEVVRWADIENLGLTAGGSPTAGGEAEATADGSTNVFRIESGVAADNIRWVHVTPRSAPATVDHEVDRDGSDIVITYFGTPDEGAEMEWWWTVGLNETEGEGDTPVGAAYDAPFITHSPADDLPNAITHADITDQSQIHPPRIHGGDYHVEDYLTAASIADFLTEEEIDARNYATEAFVLEAVSNVDGGGVTEHGNEMHTEPYATEAALTSLQNVVSSKADSGHDNSEHSEEYATVEYVDGLSGGSSAIVDGTYDGELTIDGDTNINGVTSIYADAYQQHLKMFRGDLGVDITPTYQGDSGGLQIGISNQMDGTEGEATDKVSYIRKASDEFANLYLNDGQTPVWHAGNLDPDSLGGGGTTIDGDNLIQNGWTTIYVRKDGSDVSGDGSSSNPYLTVQKAADEVPIINPDGGIEINVGPGTYNEDVMVGPYLASGGDGGNFRIVGDRNDRYNYRIRSMAIHGVHGINAAAVWGITFFAENTAISSGAGLFIYASTNAEVDSIAFEGGLEEGVSFYGGCTGAADSVDVSNVDYGIVAKGESTVSAYYCFGHANQYPFWATETAQLSYRFNDATAGSSSSYFDLIQLDNGSIGASRNGTMLKNVEVGGTLNVSGNKNFVHELDDGTKIYYTAQESGEARAVYEGQKAVTKGETEVTIPWHFAAVASKERPKMLVQATPHDLAMVACSTDDRTPEKITIESSEDTKVDIRVTAIRDGQEGKEIVKGGTYKPKGLNA